MAVTSPTYRLSDAQWDQIKDFLPANGHKGGQWKDHRPLIDGILWALSDGGRWRNVPSEFGPWKTVYDRFRKWCRTGLWDKINTKQETFSSPVVLNAIKKYKSLIDQLYA